jgi:hypothetical protein
MKLKKEEKRRRTGEAEMENFIKWKYTFLGNTEIVKEKEL